MNNSDSGFVDLGVAKADVARLERTGFGEVIYAEGKTPEEVAAIARALAAHQGSVLATRAGKAHYTAVRESFSDAFYHERARCVVAGKSVAGRIGGEAALCCAGTSDLPVVEEAAVTLEFYGIAVRRVTDVGVAGVHRLLAAREVIDACDVVIVVAGMEGALPSVVGGLTGKPVIAVPTSVGYGANFHGLSALLGMLNSCASGLMVVNIDNGFGAAMAAARILRMARGASAQA